MTDPLERGEKMFTWIPIYTELAAKLSAYRDRQDELISMIREMAAQKLNVVATQDNPHGDKIDLAAIDPFTFYACFNRNLTTQNRRDVLAHLKKVFDLKSDVPTDFSGVPVVLALNAWFFPFAGKRKVDDISSLWTLADAVVNGEPETLDAKVFERCLQIKGVRATKLTMGMFWLNPEHYVAWDRNNRRYFGQKGINVEVTDLPTYLQLMQEVKAKLGANYPQISKDALSTYDPEPAYWAGGFQWDEERMLEPFTQGNYWQIGWKKDDPKRDAKITWERFGQIREGDFFAIKGFGGRNDLVIHYIGEVVSKSDDGTLTLQKLEQALYKGKAPKDLTDGATWFQTLIPIKRQSIIDTIFLGIVPVTDPPADPPPPPEGRPLNLILFGPPGTGKTYQTIGRAVNIIDPGFGGDHSAYKRRFDELNSQGRIDFITFHQSYSYEDFVEGIRPVLDADEESSVPRYECRPGIFKRMAVRALFDCLEVVKDDERLVPFNDLWRALQSQIESDPEKEYKGLTGKSVFKLDVTAKGNIVGTNTLSNTPYSCMRRIMQEVFEAKRTQDSISSGDVQAVVIRGCHSHLVAVVFRELKRIEKSLPRGATPLRQDRIVTEEDKTDIIQRFLAEPEKSGYQVKSEPQRERYVLIIDEINRGNISKILGELITLIEPDKRLPADNTLTVTLPYSGEKFAVPANLYLVATMNTADKSIALVDLALRRRFDFEELQVDLSVCESLDDEMQSALREINHRIVLRRDRDHQIGHAYFMSVIDEATFNRRFRKQIIPLLQEYFYNDWDGLRYVLGETGDSEGGFIRKIIGGDKREARTKWQWFFDGESKDLDCLETLRSNFAKG
jgi:5-methylcytosine-specific restriction protein B